MADRRPTRRNRGVGALLVAAVPLLVAGGLLVSTTVGSPDESGRGTAGQVVADRTPSVSSPASGSTPATPPSPARGMRPESVVVPSLGVSAAVSPIATEDGALNPPSDPQQVGWWSGGARPGGSRGAAVLTGHTVQTGGGAFDDLEQLVPGDDVLVLAGGRRLAYDVVSVRVLSRAELARKNERIFGRAGRARLVLITCEDWDGTAYQSNVVVTARPA